MAGCAPAARTNTPPGADVRRDRNVLSSEEIQASTQTDAYGIVRTLRPAWLRWRGPESRDGGSRVMVYLDGRLAGTIPALRDLPAAAIREMRYLDPATATMRFGGGHGSGAIEVTSR